MATEQQSYFVCAALIAAKLHQATRIARELSLTASNARAVALRAGEKAAGFRPLTDHIDLLAEITMKSSSNINHIAAQLSRISTEKVRAEQAISRFNIIFEKAKGQPFLPSLQSSYQTICKNQNRLAIDYQRQSKALSEQLAELANELRTAVILATLSRVEASQAGSLYQESLNNVADNVEAAAGKIRELTHEAIKLVGQLT